MRIQIGARKGGLIMSKMLCVGIGRINEGKSNKNPANPDKPYKMQDTHFSGKSKGVEGVAVAKVTLDLLADGDELPEILLGGEYIVDLSDKGFLRNLELLVKPVATETRNLKVNATQ